MLGIVDYGEGEGGVFLKAFPQHLLDLVFGLKGDLVEMNVAERVILVLEKGDRALAETAGGKGIDHHFVVAAGSFDHLVVQFVEIHRVSFILKVYMECISSA
ncbi:hypothetical protein TRIP_E360019 [uncultured Spirochaetota bacterium]|nr:hypothetical protein TRIP_E360019 [uncultured Spirochaetota bacterium]